MAQTELYIDSDGIHPIDIAEEVAHLRDWDFDRLAEDQMVMAIEGQWRSYSLTLAWSARDEVLRLVCSFDLEPPQGRRPALFEVLNLINDAVWEGSFSYWAGQRQMVWRYGLVLGPDQMPMPDQVDQMVANAVKACERFYPSFQLVGWADADPRQALDIALGETYGRA